MTDLVGSRELKLANVADELRADAANALFYSTDPADVDRFRALRSLAARLMSFVDMRDENTIERQFMSDQRRTPLFGVVVVLNDQRRGVLLIDGGGLNNWTVPRRYIQPGETPEQAAKELARTLFDGEEVMPVPHGVCDSISAGAAQCHTYYLTFVVDVTFIPEDSFATSVARLDETDPDMQDTITRYIVEGSSRTVLDAPFALPASIRSVLEDIESLMKTGVDSCDPYNSERCSRIAGNMEAILSGTANETPLKPYDFGPLDTTTPLAGAEALILDDQQRILLMKRSDNHQWAMPGGACEVGESSAATAARECMEELLIEVEIDGLVGVYSSNEFLLDSPFICFLYVASLADASQKPGVSNEALDFGWYTLDELAKLNTLAGHETKIRRALKAMAG